MNKFKIMICNALIAGGLVFLGAFTDGNITKTELIATASGALAVVLVNIKDFLSREKPEENRKLMQFI